MFKQILTGAAVAVPAAAVAIFGFVGAAAAGTSQNISFFTGGAGTAHWAGSGHGAVTLSVPDNNSYAGFNVHHFPTTLDAGASSFAYSESGSATGGAPRMVFEMSNGDTVIEYAYPVTTDGTTLNTAGQWDIYGSSYRYNVPADSVTSDEAGATVQSEFMVSDSYTGAHSEVITSLTENGNILIG